MARSPLALGVASGRSRPINAASLVNLYAEPTAQGSVSPWVLFGTPGQVAWHTIGSQTIRAGRLFDKTGYAYILSGQTVYRVDSSGNAIACTGDTPDATGDVYITDNGTQVGLLVNGSMFYITGTSITKVTDGDFPAAGAGSLDYIDGYGIFSTADNSGQWFLSGLFDFSAYDALDFATAESSPDHLIRVLALHKEVWLFGLGSIEVWQLTGASPFPFEQIPGSLMNRGIGAALSATTIDNSVIWLGDDRIVYRADGYTPARISDFAVEESIRTGTVSDAKAMTYAQGGHHFYVLTFPTLGRTWVYDAATQHWHLRQTGTELAPAAWNVNCIFNAFDNILVGTDHGMVNALDLDTYTDNGSYIRRAVRSMPVYPEGKRGLMRTVELECELGVGISTGQGAAPQTMLRFSRDGGMTFGNEKWVSLGATGVRRKRAKWENLGAFRNGVAEISIADPVKVAIYGARYEAEGLAN